MTSTYQKRHTPLTVDQCRDFIQMICQWQIARADTAPQNAGDVFAVVMQARSSLPIGAVPDKTEDLDTACSDVYDNLIKAYVRS